jgi:hypothetical protein
VFLVTHGQTSQRFRLTCGKGVSTHLQHRHRVGMMKAIEDVTSCRLDWHVARRAKSPSMPLRPNRYYCGTGPFAMGGKPHMVAASRLLVGSTSLSATIQWPQRGVGTISHPSDGADSEPATARRPRRTGLFRPIKYLERRRSRQNTEISLRC